MMQKQRKNGQRLLDLVREGEIRVLIGSTEKCGTGVNVQDHVIALHHIDCPWVPAHIEQREGRGIRQGNEKYQRPHLPICDTGYL